MTIIEAIVLGIVQGLTEFLPVSSTAHLRIVPALLGWDDPGAAFTAVLQLGSLVAVIGYFMKDLLGDGARGAATALSDRSRPPEPAARQLLYIIVGTIPVGRRRHRCSSTRSRASSARSAVIAAAQIVVRPRARRRRQDVAQDARPSTTSRCATRSSSAARRCSRSCRASRARASRCSRRMALGFERPAAARFSFLLSVPAVAGAGIFELPRSSCTSHDVGDATLALGLAVDRRRELREHRLAAQVPAHAHDDPVRRLPRRARRAHFRVCWRRVVFDGRPLRDVVRDALPGSGRKRPPHTSKRLVRTPRAGRRGTRLCSDPPGLVHLVRHEDLPLAPRQYASNAAHAQAGPGRIVSRPPR